MDIERLVIVANTGEELDLAEISESWGNCEYDKEQFPGIIMDMGDDKGLIMFQSGNIVISGSSGMKEAREDLDYITDRLKDAGVDLPEKMEFKVQSVQARIELGGSLDLEEVKNCLEEDLTEYDPDRYPALLYGERDGRYQMLIFPSGNVVFTGSDDTDLYLRGAERLIERLRDGGIELDDDNGGD